VIPAPTTAWRDFLGASSGRCQPKRGIDDRDGVMSGAAGFDRVIVRVSALAYMCDERLVAQAVGD